jgi:hypothetical protein
MVLVIVATLIPGTAEWVVSQMRKLRSSKSWIFLNSFGVSCKKTVKKFHVNFGQILPTLMSEALESLVKMIFLEP